MDEDIKPSYYSILPASIRYNKNLRFGERLLYGEITALTNKEGYCYAKNKYFADLYDVSQSTISRWISHLAEINSIKVEIIRKDNKEIIERRIYITDNPYMQKYIYPYTQNMNLCQVFGHKIGVYRKICVKFKNTPSYDNI